MKMFIIITIITMITKTIITMIITIIITSPCGGAGDPGVSGDGAAFSAQVLRDFVHQPYGQSAKCSN